MINFLWGFMGGAGIALTIIGLWEIARCLRN